MSSQKRSLSEILQLRNEIVHPYDLPKGSATFVGLEHIEPHTGRKIGGTQIQLEGLTGRKSRFYVGDIVYGYLRPYLNKVWVADIDGYCSVDQYVFRVNADVAEPYFVAQFMRSPAYLSSAPIDMTPGQLPRIRTDEVLSVRLEVPPLAEQRQIADKLNSAFKAANDAREGVLQELNRIRLLRDRVVDSTFQGRASGRLALMREVGSLQDGDWILTADYSPDGVRLFQVGDVGRGALLDKSNRHVSRDRAHVLKCTFLRPDDVLISRMPDPIGRACLVPELGYEAITAVDVTIFRPDPKVLDKAYAVQLMNSPSWLSAVAARASGATRARISRLNLEAMEISLPAVDVQRRIARELAERLEAIQSVEALLIAQVAAIEDLPAALLRQEFDEIAA